MLGNQMELELREQPGLFSRNWSGYQRQLSEHLRGQSFDLVLLVARGSSEHAALYARYLIEISCGIPVSLAAPSVWTRYGSRVRYPKSLAVGISQSGAAPDVAEVLKVLRDDGHTTLAITNTPGSRVTESATFSLMMEAGPELAVAATKTYSSSLLALYALAMELGGSLPPPELPNDHWVSECESHAVGFIDSILEASTIFALARGYRFASANEAALKLMECALLGCKAYSAADFEHGPRALLAEGVRAIAFGKDIDVKRRRGTELLYAPERGGIPESISPLWDAPFLQWLALKSARALGLDPDSPESLKKVTETL